MKTFIVQLKFTNKVEAENKSKAFWAACDFMDQLKKVVPQIFGNIEIAQIQELEEDKPNENE